MRKKALLSILSVIILASLSCSVIPLRRTLPPEVKTVYVPMFMNKTHKPGLEETATNFTVEEFLADGRLTVISKPEADIWIEVEFKEYSETPNNFESDEFNMTNEMELIGTMKVYKTGDKKPILETDIDTKNAYLADTRYSTVELPVDAQDNLLRMTAEQIVQKIMTGDYAGKQNKNDNSGSSDELDKTDKKIKRNLKL